MWRQRGQVGWTVEGSGPLQSDGSSKPRFCNKTRVRSILSHVRISQETMYMRRNEE